MFARPRKTANNPSNRARRRAPGFTLIELLIVIAIIAILALIAIPNFIEAQTRAKVSRAMADMRSVATGLESYLVDYNDYPPSSCDGLAILPPVITTPIAYLTSKDLLDPFVHPGLVDVADRTRYYTYGRVVGNTQRIDLANGGCPPPQEVIDHAAYNPGAMRRYGHWRLVSKGPDGVYLDRARFPRVLYGSDIPYDPTNGTVSFGNIFRLQNCRPYPTGALD